PVQPAFHSPSGPDRRTGKSASSAHHVPVPAICRQWRPHVLRRRLPSHVSPRCRLRCPGTQRYQARRSTGGASVEVRACDQPQGGQGDRHRVSDRNSRARRRGDRMIGRREFTVLLGGAAAAWPLTARAQQPAQIRRVGLLMIIGESDPQTRADRDALESGLHALGWVVERNIHLEYRWTDGDETLLRKYAAELVGMPSDVLVTEGTAAMAAAKRATKSIPIIFVNVSDPVGQGFVASLARPGGNATGFT